MTSRSSRRALLAIALCWPVAFLAMQLVDPIAQDPAYHEFAATGSWWGLPNFWNVLSNLVLVGSGLRGLVFLAKRGSVLTVAPEAVFFFGLILTGFGSAYYHFAPDNQTLIWDRLPMTIAFMALFMAIIGHCLDRKVGVRFLPVALAVGVASVIHWASTESSGQGDLRYYLVIQFLPMLLVPTLLLWRPPTTLNGRWIWIMLWLYIAAKACELLDYQIADLLPFELTGHVMKHLFAGASGCAFLQALKRSRECPVGSRTGIPDRKG